MKLKAIESAIKEFGHEVMSIFLNKFISVMRRGSSWLSRELVSSTHVLYVYVKEILILVETNQMKVLNLFLTKMWGSSSSMQYKKVLVTNRIKWEHFWVYKATTDHWSDILRSLYHLHTISLEYHHDQGIIFLFIFLFMILKFFYS